MITKRENGFTLMELIVVIAVLGIIASFAISNFDKTIQKSRERDIILQLNNFYAVNLLYKARTGNFWRNGVGAGQNYSTSNANTINSGLNINLVTQRGYVWSYSYYSNDTYWFDVIVDSKFSIGITNTAGFPRGTVCCSSGSGPGKCPSLPSCAPGF